MTNLLNFIFTGLQMIKFITNIFVYLLFIALESGQNSYPPTIIQNYMTSLGKIDQMCDEMFSKSSENKCIESE